MNYYAKTLKNIILLFDIIVPYITTDLVCKIIYLLDSLTYESHGYPIVGLRFIPDAKLLTSEDFSKLGLFIQDTLKSDDWLDCGCFSQATMDIIKSVIRNKKWSDSLDLNYANLITNATYDNDGEGFLDHWDMINNFHDGRIL